MVEEYFFIILPILTFLPFLIGHHLLKKAELKLTENEKNHYQTIKNRISKKFLSFLLFFPILMVLKASIDSEIGTYIYLVLFLVLFIFSLFFYYKFYLNEFKKNALNPEFILRFKQIEAMKFIFFLFIGLLIYLSF
jgi:hypothetical protein